MVPLLLFRAWIITDWSVLLDQIALQLDREGIKEREDGEKGGGGGGGGYSREAIILKISIK